MRKNLPFFALLILCQLTAIPQSKIFNESFTQGDEWLLTGNWKIESERLELTTTPRSYDFYMQATSPVISLPVGANELNLAISQFYSNNADGYQYEYLQVIIIADGIENIIWEHNTQQGNWGVPAGSSLTVSLLEYEGKDINICFRATGGDTDNINYWWIYEINIDGIYNYDLKFDRFVNLPSNSWQNRETSLTASILNTGLFGMSDLDYELRLMQVDVNGDIILTTVPGQGIEPGQTAEFTLRWVPDQTGTKELYVVINAPGDMVPVNNRSEIISIVVYGMEARFHVRSNGNDANDGTTWATAFQSFQYAIDLANPSPEGFVEIWVAAGVYRPAGIGGSRFSHFSLKNRVAVYGGFTGNESSLEERDWLINTTTLCGDLNRDDIWDDVNKVWQNRGDNAYNVFNHQGIGLNETAILDGFTIRRGHNESQGGGGMNNEFCHPTIANVTFTGNYAGNNSYYYGGGGMRNIESSPHLSNIAFLNNYSAGYGGGLLIVSNSSPILKNVQFTENQAQFGGGGVYMYYSSPLLENVNFNANVVNGTGWWQDRGGAMRLAYSNPVIRGGSFTNNQAKTGGGLSCEENSMPQLYNVLFEGNTAISNDWGNGTGGGMAFSGGVAILDGVFFHNNNAREGGAISLTDNGSLTLTNVVFEGNTATSHIDFGEGLGGAIFKNSGTLTATGVKFRNNSAARGGGICNYGGNGTLINALLVNNHAVNDGGALYLANSHFRYINSTIYGNTAGRAGAIYGYNHSSSTLINTIIWNNGEDAIIDEYYSTWTAEYSNIEGIEQGSGNFSVFPGFTDALNGDFTLAGYSLCIDAGTNDVFSTGNDAAGVTVDLTGNPRVMNQTVDMGAYEYQQPVLGVTFTFVDIGNVPIENVSVTLTSQNFGFNFERKTGVDGTALLSPALGDYQYRAVKEGFLTTEGYVTVDNGDVALDFTMGSASPSIQSRDITITHRDEFGTGITWTSGSGEKRAVFMAKGEEGIAVPADSVTYLAASAFEAGDSIAGINWFCVYNGPENNVTVTGLEPGISYIIMVTEYNGAPGAELYNRAVDDLNPLILYGSPFTDMAEIILPAIRNGQAVWADIFNDGNLDILYTGIGDDYYGALAGLYKNMGNGSFSAQSSDYLRPVRFSTIATGDYNNNGQVDFLFSGNNYYESWNKTHLYINEGNNNITNSANEFAGYDWGSIAFGDYNNNGLQDIIVTGNYWQTHLYRNNGDGTFTEIDGHNLPGVQRVAWGDYNNNGYKDLLISGNGSEGIITRVYANNNGDGTFTNSGIELPGAYHGSVAWGDYNNDGYPDILITGIGTDGYYITRVFRNEGDGTFTGLTGTNLPDAGYGTAAWGDYNNNGLLDIVINGFDTGGLPISKIFTNNGDNTFSEIDVELVGVEYSHAAWGDFNNNGNLDLLINGEKSIAAWPYVEPITRVYRNNNPVVNTPPSAPANLSALPVQNNVTLNWDKASDNETPADGLTYNLRVGREPGGIDIVSPLSCLETGRRRIPAMGNINHARSFPLKDLKWGTFYWSVQAVDGGLMGGAFAQEETFDIGPSINNVFTAVSSLTSATVNASIETFDLEFDILFFYKVEGAVNFMLLESDKLSAETANGVVKVTALLENLDEGAVYSYYFSLGDGINSKTSPEYTFSLMVPVITGPEVTAFGLNDATLSANVDPRNYPATILLEWGETSQMGNSVLPDPSELDGSTQQVVTAWIGGLVENTRYYARFSATGEHGTGYSEVIEFYTGCTYTIIASQPGGQINVTPGETLTYTTFSELALSYEWELQPAWAGNLTWADSIATVQWADDFSGNAYLKVRGISGNCESIWSDPLEITVHGPLFMEVKSVYLPGIYYGQAVWADLFSDGHLDILYTGRSYDENYPVSGLFRNTGEGTFIQQSTDYMHPLKFSSISAGDFNNNGMVDFLFSGNYNYYGWDSWTGTILYSNEGNNNITKLSNEFAGYEWGSIAFGDYNNNGLQDIIVTGDFSQTHLYRNNGDGTFTEISGHNLPGVGEGSVAWGDFNNNGYKDLLISGSGNEGVITRVYANNGDGTFTNTGIDLPGVYRGSVAWGDYNNDGNLDILITGLKADGYNRIARIFRNEGDGTFTGLTGTNLPDLEFGTAAWGDYNNNGFLDIAINGLDNNNNSVSKIFTNNGDNTFFDSGIELPNLYFGHAAWGDFNNNGNLDLLLNGWGNIWNGSFWEWKPVTRVYRNNNPVVNTPPTAPGELSSTIEGTTARMTWGMASDNETPAAGLTYNLRVGSEPGGINIVSPLSCLETGRRRIPAMGNINHARSFPLKDLKWGTYYWSVQAVDGGFMGGAFSQEETFDIGPSVMDVFTAVSSPTSATVKASIETFDLEFEILFYYKVEGAVDFMLLESDKLSAERVDGIAKVTATLESLNEGAVYSYYFSLGDGINSKTSTEYTFNLMAPVITGMEVTAFGLYDATFSANVDPSGYPATILLEWGETSEMENSVAADPFEIDGSTPQEITAWIGGLVENTRYYARFSATGEHGTGYSEVIEFYTGCSYTIEASQPWGQFDVNPGETYIYETYSALAVSYEWDLQPSWAGNLTWAGNIATVQWADDFSGNAYLKVRGISGICESIWSDALVITVHGQLFMEVKSVDLPGLYYGQAVWADMYNNGHLDILYTGSDDWSNAQAGLFKNMGDGTFSPEEINNLIPLVGSSIAQGDKNNNGRIDFLFTGHSSQWWGTNLYVNENDNIINRFDETFAGYDLGNVEWVDYNNNGLQDFVVAGDGQIHLYRNNGNGTFTLVDNHNLPGLNKSSIAWGDYNNNGYKDLLIAGEIHNTENWSWEPTTSIYANNGDGTFTKLESELPGLKHGSAAWGDYNNDGYLDILVTGLDQWGNYTSGIFTNNGNGTFTGLSGAGLTGIAHGTAAWGDYNNNGLLDIALSGQVNDNSDPISIIYHNNGDGTFTGVTFEITPIQHGHAAWGDFNNNGNLDLLINGETRTWNSNWWDWEYHRVTKLYRNNSPVPNTPPTAPGDLSSTIEGTTARMTWGMASDNETTDARGLTYNLRVGSEPGGIDIMSPLSCLETGKRRIPAMGNINHARSFPLKDLKWGTYYWSVQAVDGGFMGGAFSQEETFNIGPSIIDISTLVNSSTSATIIAKVESFSLEFGISLYYGIEGDNHYSTASISTESENGIITITALLQDLVEGAEYSYYFYFEDGVSNMSSPKYILNILAPVVTDAEVTDVGLNHAVLRTTVNPQGYPATVFLDWGETTGLGNSLPATPHEIDGEMVQEVTAQVDGLAENTRYFARFSAMNEFGWGYSPILEFHTGCSYTVEANQPWGATNINPGETHTYETSSQHAQSYEWELTPADAGTLTWENNIATVVWAGDYSGQASLRVRGLSGFCESIWSPGLDITVHGLLFMEVTSAGLTGIGKGQAVWADLYNDGYLDILLSGTSSQSYRNTEIFKNAGSGRFNRQQVSDHLTGMNYSRITLGDYNNNGKVDFIITGHGEPALLYGNDGDSDIKEVFSFIGNYRIVEWVDIYNNGLGDLILSDGSTTRLYKNHGNGAFAEVYGHNIPSTTYGSIASGDYNNNGFKDLLIAGWIDGTGRITRVYINNEGDGTFTLANIDLPGVSLGNAIWGDYNNDGHLDILITGLDTSENYISKIFTNNGNGTFTELSGAGLTGVSDTTAIWGDYSNNGFMDIIFSGVTNGDDLISKIYHNNGDGTFTREDIEIAPVRHGHATWGDYNNNGKLDLLINGETFILDEYSNWVTVPVTKLYRNNSPVSNTPPTAPGNLNHEQGENMAWLSWDRASDNETAADGLTYNFRVGSEPGGINIVSPLSCLETGKRRIPAMGNTNHARRFPLRELKWGTYYWSVQAVDAGFMGGPFAQEESFVTGPSEPYDVDFSGVSSSQINISAKIRKNHSIVNVYLYYRVKGVGTYQVLGPGQIQIEEENDIISLSANLNDLTEDLVYEYYFELTDFTSQLESAKYEFSLNTPVILAADVTETLYTEAHFTARIDPRKYLTLPVLEWGKTMALGNSTAASPTEIDGADAVDVSVFVGGLEENTVYYYRFTATNEFGITRSEIKQFRTGCSYPVYTSVPSGRSDICPGDLAGYQTLSDLAESYVWELHPAEAGNLSSAENSVSVSWATNFQGTAWLKARGISGSCESIWSDELSITLHPNPAQRTITGEAQACNDAVVLYKVEGSPQNYSWSVESGMIVDESLDHVTVKWSAGTGGKVIFEEADPQSGCITRSELEVGMMNFTVPAMPEIHAKGAINILICKSPGLSYQWLKNNSPIPGATGQFYVARNNPGDYRVQVEWATGCTNISNEINVKGGLAGDVFSIFPNPARQVLNVSLESELTGRTLITISRQTGEIVYKTETEKTDIVFEDQMLVNSLVPGVYIITIEVEGGEPISKKLVIN